MGSNPGYLFFYFTDLDQSDWEISSVTALGFVIRDPPTCMINLVAKEGARVMHVFFRDNLIPMEKCLELNKKEYAPTAVCKASEEERSGKSLGSENSVDEDEESLGSPQSTFTITTFALSLLISHLFI